MPLNGISLLDAPTSVAWTGGTATVYDKDGTVVSNGLRVSDSSESDPRVRGHITFKGNPHRQLSDGSFNKAKRDIIITVPFALADGSYSYQVVRISMETHPEFEAASGVMDNLRHLAGQCILDAETDDFFDYGSTS